MADEKQAWTGDRRILSNTHLSLEVLPELGGKVASLSLAGEGGTLLQGPLRPYAKRTPTMPFDAADGSGWDECLPSVGPCQVQAAGKTVSIEDHGDVWRLPWAVEEASETRLRLRVRAPSLPLEFTRTLRLEGPVLHADYTVKNTGGTDVPYGWSMHPLFAVAPMDRIILPPSVRQVQVEASANGRVKPGSTVDWPMTPDARDGAPLDLGLAGSPDDGVGDKLILPSPAEGWCALERKTLRTRLTLHFDPKQLPWLGLWLCYGGWPQGEGHKGYTVALEPCNLPVDSLADSLTQNGGAKLAAGEEAAWTVRLELSRAEER